MSGDMPVAIIEPIGGHGGMNYYDFGLCRGLLAAGCRVSLYTCDETADPAIAGLRFYPIYRRIFGQGNRWMRACHYLSGNVGALTRAAIHGERVCHLHIFQGAMEEISLVVLSKLFRRKVIITVHDVESFTPGATSSTIIGRVYRLADRLVVHNQISKCELIEKLGVPPARIDVIPSGNYINDVFRISHPIEARRALGISETSRVILFFGHIKEVKGLDILLEAIPVVARKIPEVTLLIAGRPLRKDFSSYERLIDRLGIRDRCVLHIRYIPDDELPLYFAAAEVVTLPYRRIYQSAVILMAMSYGRAVIVSDLPGMTEVVTDGQNGYVFEQASAQSLSEQLIRALQDEQGREEVALRALEYIRQNHDWEHIGTRTLSLYRSVLSKCPPSA
jgi:glycosyltransferase involved in cell wall biosynthesis